MALGDSNIVGDVTNTLKVLLTVAGLDVTLDSPASLTGSGDFKKVNLFLYQVLENPFAKNQPWESLTDIDQRYPSLALNLYYMLTPYASDALSAHQVLGHAMGLLHDHSIVSGAELAAQLSTVVDQLAIVLTPTTLEDLTRIWNALQSPYRLSVCYEVRIALIQSEIHREVTRVSTKIDVFKQI